MISAQRRAKVASLGTFYDLCASKNILTRHDELRLGEMDRDHYLGPTGRSDLEMVSTRDGLGSCWRRPRERRKVAKDRARDLNRELQRNRRTVNDIMTKASETLTKVQMRDLSKWVREEEQKTWEAATKKLKTKLERMIKRESDCKNHHGCTLMRLSIAEDDGLGRKSRQTALVSRQKTISHSPVQPNADEKFVNRNVTPGRDKPRHASRQQPESKKAKAKPEETKHREHNGAQRLHR